MVTSYLDPLVKIATCQFTTRLELQPNTSTDTKTTVHQYEYELSTNRLDISLCFEDFSNVYKSDRRSNVTLSNISYKIRKISFDANSLVE